MLLLPVDPSTDSFSSPDSFDGSTEDLTQLSSDGISDGRRGRRVFRKQHAAASPQATSSMIWSGRRTRVALGKVTREISHTFPVHAGQEDSVSFALEYSA
jgi:hypothetical protein